MIKNIRNVVGFELIGTQGAKRLRDALQPYADYPEVREHLRLVNRFIPARRERNEE